MSGTTKKLNFEPGTDLSAGSFFSISVLPITYPPFIRFLPSAIKLGGVERTRAGGGVVFTELGGLQNGSFAEVNPQLGQLEEVAQKLVFR